MKRLKKILSELHPNLEITRETRLIDEGILDSLDIVKIVTAIDGEFDVLIPAEEIMPENFNSAKALMELVERLEEE